MSKLKDSTVRKQSIVIGGHKTSVSMEPKFWAAFCELAERQHMTLSQLAQKIDDARTTQNLSSSIRMAVLADAQERASK